jgi:hypothetical protein
VGLIRRARVVSKPGAAIEVTDIELTPAGKAALTVPHVLALLPYRASDTAAALRDENAMLRAACSKLGAEVHRLREHNARLLGKRWDLKPFGSPCPKCGHAPIRAPAFKCAGSMFWGLIVRPEHMAMSCHHCGARWRTVTRDGAPVSE